MSGVLTSGFLRNCLENKIEESKMKPKLQVLAGCLMDKGKDGFQRIRLHVHDGVTSFKNFIVTAKYANTRILKSHAILMVNDIAKQVIGGGTTGEPETVCLLCFNAVIIDEPDEVLGKPVEYISKRSIANNNGVNPNADKGKIYPITALTPYQNKWKILAKCTHKQDMHFWNKSGSHGNLFNMTFTDESGEIRATAFNQEANQLFDIVLVGQMYYVSGGAVKMAKRQYSSVNNEYEVAFGQKTVIEEAFVVEDKIPDRVYSFTPMNKLHANIGKLTDFIGVVTKVSDLTELKSKQGRTMVKREITMCDDSRMFVRLTLWDQTARDFAITADGPQILACKGVRVQSYNQGKLFHDSIIICLS